MIYLLVIFLCTGVLCHLVNRFPSKGQHGILLYGAIGNYLFLFFYKGMLWLAPSFDFEFWLDLPLAPCNLASLLIIFAVYYKNELLLAFSFIFGTASSLVALLTPVDGFVNPSFFSVEILFYFYHGFVFCLSVMVLTTGLYRPKFRHIPQTGLLFTAMAVVVHGINLLLIATVEPQANYFFTYGIPGNPISDWARSIVDVNIFLLIPLLAIWFVVMFVFFLVYGLVQRRKGRNKP